VSLAQGKTAITKGKTSTVVLSSRGENQLPWNGHQTPFTRRRAIAAPVSKVRWLLSQRRHVFVAGPYCSITIKDLTRSEVASLR
jgi:hypothetical protein